MKTLKEYLFLQEETRKLNNFLFERTLEDEFKEDLPKSSPYYYSILSMAKRCDQKMNKLMKKTYIKRKTLQRK